MKQKMDRQARHQQRIILLGYIPLQTHPTMSEEASFDVFTAKIAEQQQAMYDPELEEMIMEAHEYYLAEEKVKLREEDFAKILDLVVRYLPSGIPDEEEAIAIPPLTIGDVFGKLQEDKSLQGSMK